jgi:eukaryotic-like serine/threonine-protein kinase
MDILSALQYLHCLDPVVIHCDLKPANFMLTCNSSETSLKLIDFGLARRCEHHLGSSPHVTRKTPKIGTPRYAAPELFQCQVFDDGHRLG